MLEQELTNVGTALCAELYQNGYCIVGKTLITIFYLAENINLLSNLKVKKKEQWLDKKF